MDNNFRIRIGLNQLLIIIIKLNKKLIRNVISFMIPWLWLSCSDAVNEVSQSAILALETLFPVQVKRIEILQTYSDNIFTLITEYLKHTVDSLHESAGVCALASKEDAIERYERVTTATIHSIQQWVLLCGQFNQLHTSTLVTVVSDEHFWKRLYGRNNRACISIRMAMVTLLGTICKHSKELLYDNCTPETSPVLINLCTQICTQELLLRSLQEGSDGWTMDACMQTWLSLVCTYGGVYWYLDKLHNNNSRVIPVKCTLNTLRGLIFEGAGRIVHFIALIINSFPTCYISLCESESECVIEFIQYVLAEGKKGASDCSVEYTRRQVAVHSALIEVCTVLLLKHRGQVSVTDLLSHTRRQACIQCLCIIMLELVTLVTSSSPSTLVLPTVISLLSRVLSQFNRLVTNSTAEDDWGKIFWGAVLKDTLLPTMQCDVFNCNASSTSNTSVWICVINVGYRLFYFAAGYH